MQINFKVSLYKSVNIAFKFDHFFSKFMIHTNINREKAFKCCFIDFSARQQKHPIEKGRSQVVGKNDGRLSMKLFDILFIYLKKQYYDI